MLIWPMTAAGRGTASTAGGARPRRARLCAALAAGAMLLAACTADGGAAPAPTAPPSTQPGTPRAGGTALATLRGNGWGGAFGAFESASYSQLLVDVLAVERRTPDAVLLSFRVRNQGDAEVLGFDDVSHGPYVGGSTLSALSLLDLAGGRVSFPMEREDNGRCLCTYLEPGEGIEPGASVAGFAVYELPASTDRVAVSSPALGDITPLLPVTAPGEGGSVPGAPDAETIETFGKGKVEGLVTHTSAKDVTSRGGKVEIVLRADVLFEFDKASLTAAARRELREVARRLRDGARGTVAIVGHTDDVGTDAYNQDLSGRRAASVHRALAGMLEGEEVDFTVAGKGEREPRESGTSAAARARNRRVEITFERPAPTEPPPSTPPPSTAPPSTEPPAGGEPLGSTRGAGDFEGVVVDLLELRRLGPETVVATMLFRNEGKRSPNMDQFYRLSGNYPEPDDHGFGLPVQYRGGDLFWLYLSDQRGTRYFVVDDTTLYCVCANMYTNARLRPGNEARLFALLTAPPPGVDRVDVTFVGFPDPIRDVPIGG